MEFNELLNEELVASQTSEDNKYKLKRLAEKNEIQIEEGIDTPSSVLDKLIAKPASKPQYGTLIANENGVYNSATEDLDGYYKVTVAVPPLRPFDYLIQGDFLEYKLYPLKKNEIIPNKCILHTDELETIPEKIVNDKVELANYIKENPNYINSYVYPIAYSEDSTQRSEDLNQILDGAFLPGSSFVFPFKFPQQEVNIKHYYYDDDSLELPNGFIRLPLSTTSRICYACETENAMLDFQYINGGSLVSNVLNTVIIGATCNQVNEGAFTFGADASIKVLVCYAVNPPIIADFDRTFGSKAKVFVPKASLQIYKDNQDWGVVKDRIYALEDLIPQLILDTPTFDANGIYTAEEGHAYKSVNIQVPLKLPSVVDKTVTEIHAENLVGCKNIGEYALENCTQLSVMEIPPAVTEIQYHAFENCRALPTITIPATVKRVGDYAFNQCNVLKTVLFESEVPPTFGASVFSNTDPTLRIYVPVNGVDAYKQALPNEANRIFARPQ